MRGELCVGVGSLLSLVSVLLMIFVHVGQINTSNVPRNVYMAKVNVSAYGDALSFAIAPDPVFGLYTDNASAPLQAAAGLRQIYKFGIYSHCAYLNDTAGRCGNQTIGDQFKPYEAITTDMSANWSIFTQSFIPDSTFRDSKFLGHNSKAAYWMLLLGLLCAAAAFITGVAKHNMTFLVSTLFAIAGSLLLLIGASIWTVIIQRAANINDLPVHSHSGDQSVPLGIVVSLGPGLLLTWAAFACLVASVIPYMISCCTFR
ncbi:hypothetical protein Agabi119p4_741 [Agaricus bisporus var. burnettii]|uniref:Actin cortical patch SUR7/pH-response regulator PalI n=1 Tax=Agaricus bisporus var. burnettii TaxID=192524 RepID=A0A8H7FBG0_AGABI|nr:hypothetical protein Agabi119p4_741 [Agaricus bisporus var. burnettii]